MRTIFAVVAVVVLAAPFRVGVAQAPTGVRPPTPAAAKPAAPVVPVSTQLQPALTIVRQTVDAVRTDKWKRGNIRDEAAQNISQIERNIDVTLPPMLRTGDSAPSSLSTLLPILRNISALYDVLLRVVEASRVVAPDEQVVQLQQALVALGNARLALSDRIQNSATAVEQQVAELQKIVQSQAATIAITSAPIVIPCATPQPRKTIRRTTRRPAAKPTPAKPAAPTTGKK
jgi:hypothetical protein